MKISAEVVTCVDAPTDQDTMWAIYSSAFSGSAKKSVQEQSCYTKELFIQALLDAEYVKFIARVDGVIGGFVLMTNNLEKARIAYASPDFFQSRYPDLFVEKRIHYCTGLAVDPSMQKKHGLFHYLTPLITRFHDSERSLFVADYSRNSIPWLPMALMQDVLKAQKDLDLATDNAELEEIDAQVYFTIRLNF